MNWKRTAQIGTIFKPKPVSNKAAVPYGTLEIVDILEDGFDQNNCRFEMRDSQGQLHQFRGWYLREYYWRERVL